MTSTVTKLSPSIVIYPPATSPTTTSPRPPKLILLLTWMDARDIHIAKYITHYQTLYPSTTILLAKSFFRYYFSPSSALRELTPAVSVIRDVLGPQDLNSPPQLLIHLFSNGGSGMLYYIYDLYAASAAKSSSLLHSRLLPNHTTIFDSAPGGWTYSGSIRAVLVSIPAGLPRMLLFPLVQLLGLWWVVKYALLRLPEETRVWGAAHNDVGRVREAARGYVFSESDEFVDWRAVEEHAGMAVEKGFVVVRRERLRDSKHVAHARAEPERYWGLVRNTWEVGQGGGEK